MSLALISNGKLTVFNVIENIDTDILSFALISNGKCPK